MNVCNVRSSPMLLITWPCPVLFYFCYDSLESLGVVHCEVGEHLTVDFDASLVQATHELRVGKTLKTGGSVDTLNPQGAEVALLVAAIAESIGKTLFPSVLGNGPHVFAGTVITAGEFKNSLTLSS